ncbi:MAG: hypothetical protein AAB483_01645 [Patescibacteria group bacterium]
MKSCNNCHQDFEIYPEDLEFYNRFKVPEPTWCPECRLIRRMTFRNERTLYKRPCDLCHADKIFMYPADAPFPVYCWQCWWGDSWDAKAYARDYDFSKPFFEQFLALRDAVPRAGSVKQGNIVDSEYTNRVTDPRNCYLAFSSTRLENCRYGVWYNDTKDSMDCYSAVKSERCYECIDVYQCYNLAFSQESYTCRNSAFLYNCRDCESCFGCVNLRNKSYCIFNEQFSKEDYQKKIASYDLRNDVVLEGVMSKFENLKKQHIVPALVTRQSTNVTGNWIESSKNIWRSFECANIEDGRYCFNIFSGKDLMDFGPWSNNSERIYECINLGLQCGDVKFANECWIQLRDSEYCMNCHSSHNLFGCDGLRKAEYCILNKQYSKEEYETLVEKIKAQMKAAGEYGEFFPMSVSPHAYNETIAQEFFPLTKEQALAKGYRWRDPETKEYKIGGDIIACEHAGKCTQSCTTAFRITSEDKQFYEQFALLVPKLCPNCRHFERLAKRNPLKLWARQCAKCSKAIETSYSPDRPETVYCIDCYQSEIV